MRIGFNYRVPELPEVEAMAQAVNRSCTGRLVTRCQLISIAALKTFDPPLEDLEGRTSGGCRRFGKQLGIDFGNLWLVIRFARAGWIRLRAAPVVGAGRRTEIALRLRLSEVSAETPGCELEVIEAGTEKRLGLWVVRDPALVPGVAALGPDPLGSEFTVAQLERTLGGPNATLKSALTDQTRIGGIGNAYSDEILHRARLSPFQPTGSLEPGERTELHRAIVEVLRSATTAAVESTGGLPTRHRRDAFRVHGRAGQPCPDCKEVIREVSYVTRSLFYCPRCQTGGRALADRRMSRLLR